MATGRYCSASPHVIWPRSRGCVEVTHWLRAASPFTPEYVGQESQTLQLRYDLGLLWLLVLAQHEYRHYATVNVERLVTPNIRRSVGRHHCCRQRHCRWIIFRQSLVTRPEGSRRLRLARAVGCWLLRHALDNTLLAGQQAKGCRHAYAAERVYFANALLLRVTMHVVVGYARVYAAALL